VSCLQRLDPPRCALCREVFRPGQARKIHVEIKRKSSKSNIREVASDVRRLERKLAEAVLDGTQADVLSVFKEVQEWVALNTDRPSDDRNILKAFSQAAVQSLTIRELITKNYELNLKKQDAESIARGIQQSLEDKLRDMTNQYQSKRAECEKLELELSTTRVLGRSDGYAGYMPGPERPSRSRNHTHPLPSTAHFKPIPPPPTSSASPSNHSQPPPPAYQAFALPPSSQSQSNRIHIHIRIRIPSRNHIHIPNRNHNHNHIPNRIISH
jgi:hypothetical protein